jgi:hypothetical protein
MRPFSRSAMFVPSIFGHKKQRELLAHAALVIKLQILGFGFL